MTSIVTAEILKATLGLLVNKARDFAAEKLKDGDITVQQFRKLVVRELDDIKFKIDGLAKKDVLASVSFFKEGLEILYKLLDHEDEKVAVSLTSASGGSKLLVNTISLVEQVKMLKLSELGETAKQLLTDAKESFKEARVEATRAFGNESLSLSHRLLAMKIRIMATLMGKVDSPSLALASCKVCLEELHNIPAVQNCFYVEVTKSWRSRFKKNVRWEVIADVCHMKFVVNSVTGMMGGHWRDDFIYSYIDIGKLKIDPLRDVRLTKALSEFKLERCCLREWTFGQEGEVNHRLDGPRSITTNTQGQFIVADLRNVKVFDSSGMFVRFVCPFTDEERKKRLDWLGSVATDGNGNLYVLAEMAILAGKPFIKVKWCGVYVFDQNYKQHHKFPLREKVDFLRNCPLTVSNGGKVLVLIDCEDGGQVDVYETDGKFVHSFGQGILFSFWVSGITTANDDRVMVMDGRSHCVHVFSTQGDHLHQFGVQGDTNSGAIAFHQPSERVIISSWNPEYRGQVSIYTKDGEFVRSPQLDTDIGPYLLGLTVVFYGCVAVANK